MSVISGVGLREFCCSDPAFLFLQSALLVPCRFSTPVSAWMHCRSTPSAKPMPIRGRAELAERAQATASGRHVTGVPVSVVSAPWHQVIFIFFLTGAVCCLELLGVVRAVRRP